MGEIDKVLKALNKKYGDNYASAGYKLLDKDYVRNSLGVFELDMALGGGIPERKIMMLAGKPSSGKTTTMLLAIAECQKKGGKVVLIDVEHNFDPVYATKLGVDIENLYIVQSTTIEQVSDTTEALIMSGEVDLICIDSIAAAPSSTELEESATQGSMGGKAKVIGLMMVKITARLNDIKNPVKTSILILNQIREKVGLVFGDPSYVPGGTALHHLSDIIVWLRPDSKPVGGKDNPLGLSTQFKVTKNRTFPPFKTGMYTLLTCKGADNVGAVINLAISYGLIEKSGAWCVYEGKKYQGLEKLRNELSLETIEKLKKEITELVKNGPPPPTVIDDSVVGEDEDS